MTPIDELIEQKRGHPGEKRRLGFQIPLEILQCISEYEMPDWKIIGQVGITAPMIKVYMRQLEDHELIETSTRPSQHGGEVMVRTITAKGRSLIKFLAK